MPDNRNYSKLVFVVTTEASPVLAKKLAKNILKARLAACINMQPVNSLYWWEEELQETDEVQLLIKTRENLLDEVYECIVKIHSYEIPEFVFWGASSSPMFGSWIANNISADLF